ncbi:MAG: hypothetical protein K0S86_1353 [Geminicoccaceae bacterium]|nr:hypothetical protein [Geminicoccaceae bacterium]
MAQQNEPRTDAIVDRGKALAEDVREKASELVESARGEAGNLQATLADRLEAGAEAIRSRTTGTRAEPTTRAIRARRDPGRAEAVTAVADRMDRTAMWLRETDLTDFGAFLRHELGTRPGRTALIAFGIGILIGRATRR